MVKSKYEGLILNGMWKYNGYNAKSRTCVDFKNIYNGNIVTLSVRQINDVVSGKSTIGKIISRREDGLGTIGNTKRNFRRTKFKYSKHKHFEYNWVELD